MNVGNSVTRMVELCERPNSLGCGGRIDEVERCNLEIIPRQYLFLSS